MDNDLNLKLKALVEGVPHRIANLANASALLWENLQNINWAGFYLMENDMLVLGPFQGRTACIEITLSKGVCGAAARENRTIVVENVHEFPGHIACDCASNSEIVVPLRDGAGQVIGVLDIDSPLEGRFKEKDARLLEEFAAIIEANI